MQSVIVLTPDTRYTSKSEMAEHSGFNAYEYGAVIEDNPHEKADVLYYVWRRGYTLAAKRANYRPH